MVYSNSEFVPLYKNINKIKKNYFEIFMLLPRIGFRGRDRVRDRVRGRVKVRVRVRVIARDRVKVRVRARDRVRVRVSSNFTDCNHVEPPGQ